MNCMCHLCFVLCAMWPVYILTSCQFVFLMQCLVFLFILFAAYMSCYHYYLYQHDSHKYITAVQLFGFMFVTQPPICYYCRFSFGFFPDVDFSEFFASLIFCMGFFPGLCRASTDLNQLLQVIVGFGPRLYLFTCLSSYFLFSSSCVIPSTALYLPSIFCRLYKTTTVCTQACLIH